jgi:putative nucleotidyltransferase-like protein
VSGQHPLSRLESTFKKSAAALKRAGVPFVLGGGLACWARGGPETYNDLDLMVKSEDAKRALEVLVDAGMKAERPPEEWLLKAWDGDVLVDIIFQPLGMEIDDDTLTRADVLNVFSITTPVMALEDVVSTKLLALTEHFLDYEGLLQVARSLREQIDWAEVGQRTQRSPYARAFFALLDELHIVRTDPSTERHSHIRVLPAPALHESARPTSPR